MPPTREKSAVSQPRITRWRLSIFISTWLSYAGYYFCRKPFYNAKGTLNEDLGFSTTQLANIGTGYLTTYAVGQFSSAAVGTWLGPRKMVLMGMMVSLLTNATMGSWAGFASLLSMMLLNGLAQATGWPGNIGVMAAWTRRDERGTVMGVWSTCYQVGGLLASFLAAYLIGAQGWRAAFFGGAAVLLVVWV
ncbi:MAG: MFS transporter, partial [Deltaproteobacteria bacterium]|nr:MFS transporter [Deltaproteobacteria bacterium]